MLGVQHFDRWAHTIFYRAVGYLFFFSVFVLRCFSLGTAQKPKMRLCAENLGLITLTVLLTLVITMVMIMIIIIPMIIVSVIVIIELTADILIFFVPLTSVRHKFYHFKTVN